MVRRQTADADRKSKADRTFRSFEKRALRDGIILLADSPTANVLSFMPSFGILDDEIRFVASWLEAALAQPN